MTKITETKQAFADMREIIDGKKAGLIFYTNINKVTGETTNNILSYDLETKDLGLMFLLFAESIKSLLPADLRKDLENDFA